MIASFHQQKNKHHTINIYGTNNKIFLNKTCTVEGCITICGHNNTIIIGKNTHFLSTNINIGLLLLRDLPVSNCTLIIGDENSIGECEIMMAECDSTITMGNDCMLSHGIKIWCSDTHAVLDLEGNTLNQGKYIEIGNHVWIGMDVRIMRNTKISDNSIIGVGSIVTRCFDTPNVAIGGNPADIIKKGVTWSRQSCFEYKAAKGMCQDSPIYGWPEEQAKELLAQKDFGQLHALAEKFPIRGWKWLCKACLEEAQIEQCSFALGKAREAAPWDNEILLFVLVLEFPNTLHDAAISTLNKNVTIDKKYADLSSLALNNRLYKPAIECIKAAIRLKPHESEYGKTLCNIFYQQHRPYDAIAAAENILAEWPERGELHKIIAEILEQQGEHAKAQERARKAVEVDPNSVALRQYLAEMLIRHGNIEEATALSQQALAQYPTDGWPHMQLALLAENQDNTPAALEHMRAALDKQPGKRIFAAQYARLLRKNGDISASETFCQSALAADAFQGWAWRELCRCAVARGDTLAALEYGQKAVEIHPGDTNFQQYAIQLQSQIEKNRQP